MLIENNNNNRHQGLNEVRGSSDENSPYLNHCHANAPSNAGSKQSTISNNDKPQLIRSLTLRDRAFKQTSNIVPVLKQKENSAYSEHAVKSSVAQMLKNGANRTNFSGLKEAFANTDVACSGANSVNFLEPKTYKHTKFPNSPITEKGAFFPSSSTLHNSNYDTLDHFEEQSQDEDEEDDDNDGKDTTGLFDLDNRFTATEIEQIENDPTFSVLDPVNEYVYVEPPRLGKPLLPNDAPLDMSCVEKTYINYPPINHTDKDNLPKDELKLYSILDYELKLASGSLNWDCASELQGIGDEEGCDEGNAQIQSRESCLTDVFKTFFAKHFNKDVHYENKYPWHKIMSEVDHPKENPQTTDTIKGSTCNGYQFERNNTDMFPANNRFFSTNIDKFRHIIVYAPSSSRDEEN